MKTMSPDSTSVMEQVRLFSSGFCPSTGPKAPSASRMSRMQWMSWEPTDIPQFSIHKIYLMNQHPDLQMLIFYVHHMAYTAY